MAKNAHDIHLDGDYRAMGGAIEAARLASGLSKAALAERIGVSRQTIFYMIDGTRRVDVIELARIAVACRISEIDLFQAAIAGMKNAPDAADQ